MSRKVQLYNEVALNSHFSHDLAYKFVSQDRHGIVAKFVKSIIIFLNIQ